MKDQIKNWLQSYYFLYSEENYYSLDENKFIFEHKDLKVQIKFKSFKEFKEKFRVIKFYIEWNILFPDFVKYIETEYNLNSIDDILGKEFGGYKITLGNGLNLWYEDELSYKIPVYNIKEIHKLLSEWKGML